MWEFPWTQPSDWYAATIFQGKAFEDTKIALDVVVKKQGVGTFAFHPYDWFESGVFRDLVDYAAATYSRRVKFLNFHEAANRLQQHLLLEQPLQSVRLLDLNNDGFLDVVICSDNVMVTMSW